MRIGIDLGGTKTEILCLDQNGQTLLRHRIATPKGDYEKSLQSIRDLVLDAEKKLGRNGSLGIGIPGCISHKTNLVKNANSTWLIGHPLQQDLSNILQREVRIANDANCFALSEAVDGAAAEANTVFGVILGTGTGGGLVVNKQILNGLNSVGGEWGHNPLPWAEGNELPGPQCYCGKQGCIETFLSGPALARTFENITNQVIAPSDIPALPHDISDPVLAIYERRLARALAAVINLFDPEIIVLGGGVSNIDRWYDSVPALWSQWVFGGECDTRLVKAKHGDSSGVRGAAWLWSCDQNN